MINAEVREDAGIHIDYKAFSRGVGRMMREQVSREALQYFKAIVEDWVHAPDFQVDEAQERNEFSIDIYPVGPNTKYWIFVSFGVEGRMIYPVWRGEHTRQLKYQGYRPYTKPGSLSYKGPGRYFGPFFRADKGKGVWWPGIEARNFEELIIEDYNPTFVGTVTKGVVNSLFGSRR